MKDEIWIKANEPRMSCLNQMRSGTIHTPFDYFKVAAAAAAAAAATH